MLAIDINPRGCDSKPRVGTRYLGKTDRIDPPNPTGLWPDLAVPSPQAEWVKEIKRVSNLWLKEPGAQFRDFEWQGGYADLSVSQSNLGQVKSYIADQERHHGRMNFQDELGSLLRKHEIEWEFVGLSRAELLMLDTSRSVGHNPRWGWRIDVGLFPR